ncbi:hypothetical protein DPMN_021078 [Dreissena polymorpha]|uniref:Uncharacterized protein n=1 Tax=Dreissena polymorpha TaxID=45954 RepID=A0A9D4S8U9_DREPO|nr:hypothetical protein DPMN_021078 [Dreissena polymorpha]
MEKEPDKINRTVNCLPSMPALPHETGTQNKVCVFFMETYKRGFFLARQKPFFLL